MIYGDEIVALEDGLNIAPKAIEPIGLRDGSTGWGVWLWDPRKDDPRGRCPHLFISPFHPRSWPICIRLQLVLRDIEEQPGALSRATKVIADGRFEILYARATPTGHYHATCNLVVENTPLRWSYRLKREDLYRRRSRPGWEGKINWQQLAFGATKEKRSKYIERTVGLTLTPEAVTAGILEFPADDINAAVDRAEELRKELGYHAALFIRTLKALLIGANLNADGEHFLHDKLLSPKNLFWPSSDLARSTTRFETLEAMLQQQRLEIKQRLDVRARPEPPAAEQLPDGELLLRALEPRWDAAGKYDTPAIIGDGMPYLAHAWLFGDHVNFPMKFRYDGARALLSVVNREETYRSVVSRYIAVPDRVVASFHPEDCCMRICFTTPERSARRVLVRLPYVTTYRRDSEGELRTTEPYQHTSPGTLASVLQTLTRHRIDLVRLATQLMDRERFTEAGIIEVSGFAHPEAAGSDRMLEDVKRSLERILVHGGPADAFETTIETAASTIQWDRLDYLFVSTRINLLREKPGLQERLERVAERYGFEAIILNEPLVRITEQVAVSIAQSRAMLQVIPVLPGRNATLENPADIHLDWLLFEYGRAYEHIPVAICVDVTNGGRIADWQTRLPTAPDRTLFDFDSREGPDEIADSIARAIEWLRREVEGGAQFGSRPSASTDWYRLLRRRHGLSNLASRLGRLIRWSRS